MDNCSLASTSRPISSTASTAGRSRSAAAVSDDGVGDAVLLRVPNPVAASAVAHAVAVAAAHRDTQRELGLFANVDPAQRDRARAVANAIARRVGTSDPHDFEAIMRSVLREFTAPDAGVILRVSYYLALRQPSARELQRHAVFESFAKALLACVPHAAGEQVAAPRLHEQVVVGLLERSPGARAGAMRAVLLCEPRAEEALRLMRWMGIRPVHACASLLWSGTPPGAPTRAADEPRDEAKNGSVDASHVAGAADAGAVHVHENARFARALAEEVMSRLGLAEEVSRYMQPPVRNGALRPHPASLPQQEAFDGGGGGTPSARPDSAGEPCAAHADDLAASEAAVRHFGAMALSFALLHGCEAGIAPAMADWLPRICTAAGPAFAAIRDEVAHAKRGLALQTPQHCATLKRLVQCVVGPLPDNLRLLFIGELCRTGLFADCPALVRACRDGIFAADAGDAVTSLMLARLDESLEPGGAGGCMPLFGC